MMRCCSFELRAVRSSCAFDASSHVHSSSLIRPISAESLACFFGTHRPFFTDIFFGLEECNEFIAVKRGVFNGIA
ncbi:hypothetical protein SAMN05421752_107142 [Natronorubrum thiooxidans]|uniref:Uncharacterized protein n=1 Tax=Natronorubrum thiooxidans TaxID=308853 RepID=A0A1N7FMM1_9EURY|nr:hypothetical protein SAMN05421752_107142 [Natronorubrum thiooxidans]